MHTVYTGCFVKVTKKVFCKGYEKEISKNIHVLANFIIPKSTIELFSQCTNEGQDFRHETFAFPALQTRENVLIIHTDEKVITGTNSFMHSFT